MEKTSSTVKTSLSKNVNSEAKDSRNSNFIIPQISLPKGGGAIKGIEEKFQVNAVTGTSTFSIPIPLSPSRHGFIPSIGLNYNSGLGNSAFGPGWQVAIPSIARKTEKKLPEYMDNADSDTFILSGMEDLVPLLEKQLDGTWKKNERSQTIAGTNYKIKRYRPRIEGMFARIEKWENDQTGDVYWKTITNDNIHSYYGLEDKSRISHPKDESKVFEWMLCRMHDDKGNILLYNYKKEDFKKITGKLNERNRINNCTQIYLKEIWYGNKKPYYLGDIVPEKKDFMFRVVFDHGEHDAGENIPKDIDIEKQEWECRKDPFSTYRAGFEIRTYRRCKRIFLFHCFDELPHAPYLVKSLELFYDELKSPGDKSITSPFSFLTKARHNGHQWDQGSNSYKTKFLPEIEINYQLPEWNTEIKTVLPDNLVHAPAALADKSYLWIDLFSEGISGILTEKAGELFYKSNLGSANFSNANLLTRKPSFNGTGSGMLSIQELEGNGVKYLVQLENEPTGFFKLTDDEEWEPMKYFESLPNCDLLNPYMRPIDLNGDGLMDLLIIDGTKIEWYAGAGEKGFKTSRSLTKEIDEEKGPAIVFADDEQSIFLADMSGDGLTDILRIRNGEICYWPNQGYGCFGKKVNMDNAPVFDHPEAFNPALLRIADVDGSGTNDIIYLGKNDFSVWMNLNGNEWSTSQIIRPFSQINNLTDVAVLDLLGSGTACIVYSSPVNAQPFQYIDLMNSKKPYLFNGYKNNCGKEVSIEYKSSTFFYLEDKKEGNNWITKLPFPVHCISNVRSEDKIREIIFTSSYRYRHGYFDHEEREFRGFARVEQMDTEEFEQFKINETKNVTKEPLHQPPVKTISWFHTGAFLRNKKIIHQCEDEYFTNTLFTKYDMPEPLITGDLSSDELREAYRACKGLPLRSEVFAMDNSDKTLFPYSASHSSVEIRLLQPKDQNKYASFLIVPSESISYNYERNPADPRISQSFVLETDELGNVKKTSAVVYPRVTRPVGLNRIPDKVWEEQNKMHVVYNEMLYTRNDILEDDIYRLRAGYESKSYEINGIKQPHDFFFKKEDLKNGIAATIEILFEEEFDGSKQKRLSAHSRAYFYKDDLTVALPLGELSKLGIPHKSYQLAFTKNLVQKYYGAKVTDQMLIDAKYVHSENDKHWWTQPGEPIFPINPKNKFYTPVGSRDVFGNESFVEYDQYTFLVTKTTDAILNVASAKNDYRTLSPVLLTNANMNRSAVETDELGLVIKSAIMGKEGAGEGDTLADPTAKMEYDLFNWKNNGKPNYVHMLAREQHGAANPRWQESYVYSDGSGIVIMTKAQAAPGKAKHWNAATKQIKEIDANPRWTGNGRTILNNKGNPIKQYEPYFSATFEYESESALVETGMTPIYYYDPVGRNIRTEFPNDTFSKIEFDSWHFKSFDVNDTIKDSLWYASKGSPDPLGVEPLDAEVRAAWLAAKHYATPGVTYSDSLGRNIYSVSDYGNGKKAAVYSETDLAGRSSKAFDQLGRNVSEGYANLLGAAIYGKTAEKGQRWIFSDVIGRLVRIWDNDIREMYISFDRLHRPVSSFIKEGVHEILFAHVVYGDLFPDAIAKAKNIKGTAYQLYDQTGVVTIKNVDFKGTPTEAERKLAKEYKLTVNWKVLDGITNIAAIETLAAPFLEDEIFSGSARVDALGRPMSIILPDKSVIQTKYNEANVLDSLKVKIRGNGDFVTFLDSQDYDAKGQRQFAKYGNGTITKYFYDPQTFRLTNLLTKSNETDGDNQSIQNLKYTFDPAGNIVQIRDDAQQTHFFKNNVVYPESKYEYDAVYQLRYAAGREHAGLGGNSQRNEMDIPFVQQLPHENDTTAVSGYKEYYEYDDCGNIKSLKHSAANTWVTRYKYEYEDDATNKTNRLKATSLPGDADGVYSAPYHHDLHGNMTSMPHLPAVDSMQWNYMDQLKRVNLGGGGMAYYVYGPGGNRIRKIIERSDRKKIERIYLGAVEIYRESQIGSKPELERYTLHISDNTGRIAQVDTKTIDENNIDRFNKVDENITRYQYSNHLGSAMLETDVDGNVISYEEYHPYGSSAYRVSRANSDISLKRYRFSGKERDDETGFYYFGARYYAAWLGRWTSSDPAGFVDGLNLYEYVNNSPINLRDSFGLKGSKPNQEHFTYRISSNTFSMMDKVDVNWFKKQHAGIDRRINDKNAHIRFIPNSQPYGEVGVQFLPGGTWELKADFQNSPKKSGGQSHTSQDSKPQPQAAPAPEQPDASPQESAPAEETKNSPPAAENAKSDTNNKSVVGSFLNYLGAELSHAGVVRLADNKAKAAIARALLQAIRNTPLALRNLDTLQRFAHTAFSLRNWLRTADQAKLGFIGKAFSALRDSSALRTFGGEVTKAADKLKSLSSGFIRVVRNVGKGQTFATVFGSISRVAGPALAAAGIYFSMQSMIGNIKKGNYADAVLGDGTGVASGALTIVAAVAGSILLGKAALVVGVFSISYNLTRWVDEKTGMTDAISSDMVEKDQMISRLWADPNKPAYTQTLGWKLADWFGL